MSFREKSASQCTLLENLSQHPSIQAPVVHRCLPLQIQPDTVYKPQLHSVTDQRGKTAWLFPLLPRSFQRQRNSKPGVFAVNGERKEQPRRPKVTGGEVLNRQQARRLHPTEECGGDKPPANPFQKHVAISAQLGP